MSIVFLILAWITLARFVSTLPVKTQQWIDRLWAGLLSGLVVYWTFMFCIGEPQTSVISYVGVLLGAIFFMVISKDEKAYL